MTAEDFSGFVSEVRRLATVLNARATPVELQVKAEAYFTAMRRYPLRDVVAGADVWIQRGKFFPKPAEWMDAIPRRSTTVAVQQFTDEEARAYHAAELARYEGPVCGCPACLEAGCTAAQPIRFVPDFDDQDREIKAFDPLRQRVVVTGHWAHGEELKRWYAAKAAFYSKFAEFCAKKTMKSESEQKPFPQRIDEIFRLHLVRPEDPPEPTT